MTSDDEVILSRERLESLLSYTSRLANTWYTLDNSQDGLDIGLVRIMDTHNNREIRIMNFGVWSRHG